MNATRRFWADVLERVARTFAVAFLGIYVTAWVEVGGSRASDVLTDLSLLDKAAGAGIIAAGTLVLSLLAKPVGAQDSASFLPSDVDPPQPPYNGGV